MPKNSYDEFEYPCWPRPQTHPRNLAALAILSGIEPPPLSGCRVLEVGCNDGGNLTPIALNYPNSDCIGIDLAETPIQAATEYAAAAGAGNVRYFAMNLMDWTGELGQFDYIIAHGFYSWVPSLVRARLLEICANSLTPNGLAFISYNAYPGCYFRKYVSGLLRIYTRNIESPKEKVARALEISRSILASPPKGAKESIMHDELKDILEKSPSVIYHDDLAAVNDAFTITEFSDHLSAAGLQLLRDADPARDGATNANGPAESWLEKRQLADYIAARRFRESIVCRARLVPQRESTPAQYGRLHAFTSAEAHPEVDGEQTFKLPKGEIKVRHPQVRNILNQLCEAVPGSVSVRSLHTWDGDPDLTASILERLQTSGAASLVYDPIPVVAEPGEMPRATAMARQQALRGDTAFSSQRHVPVKLADPVSRRLLTLLDGTKDRQTLFAELNPGGTLEEFNQNLAAMGRLGLFVA